MNPKQFCLELAWCDSENNVIKLLRNAGYWDDSTVWRYYGDNENNFATIGNQQSRPDAAIVEKIINSVDAVLMAECLKRGIDPESSKAPQFIVSALEEYFSIPAGKLSNLTATERTKLSEKIRLVTTGRKTRPCYAIIDQGEGQTPRMMPDTLLSIGKSNKLRIPFVQGKFNMGGTGVLQFCGRRNLQLIISRRHPEIAKHEYQHDPSATRWGFTIVRREDPTHGVRSSTYKYLAPDNEILSFPGEPLPLLPGDYPSPYKQLLKWGTFIKLYEYQMTGLRTHIVFDLYYRLSLLMPSIALPIRLYERRKGYSGHTHETTLAGLTVRLEEDKRENLESGFPTSSTLTVQGQEMKVSIFAFKRGKSERYSKSEGVVFVVNGQTHGHLPKAFFTRQAVNMSYLADSLLVLVDCSGFEGRTREDLFMNSRDRLRAGELRSEIERGLEEILRNHPGLRALREQRRREDVEDKLEDSKPLAEILETIIKKSPTLSQLFVQGVKIPDPFRTAKAQPDIGYQGQRFPTIFKLIKEYPADNPRQHAINRRLRIQYTTDVANDYFDRDKDPGNFELSVNGSRISDFSVNLWNGTATLNITLPSNVSVGDNLWFQSKVSDISRVDPLISEFYVLVERKQESASGHHGQRKPPASDESGNAVDRKGFLELPNIIEIRQGDWNKHNFDRESALVVKDSGEEGYDFFINMDNVYLLTEKKTAQGISPTLLDARYRFGMVLLGIALLRTRDTEKPDVGEDNGSMTIFQKIEHFTKAVSPILLPMIAGLGELHEDEIVPIMSEF